MNSRRQVLQYGAGASLLASLGALPAWSQAFDTVKVLMGFAAGGANDTVARGVASKMGASNYVRGSALVENRTGAGGQIACAALKSAPADGSIILCAPFSCTALYPHTYKTLPYDPLVDFVSVSTAASFPLVLSIGQAVPVSVRTLPEYLAWVKEDLKTRGAYANPGSGSIAHFVGALLGLEANLDMTAIAYRGSAPAVADTVGGQIPAMVTGITELLAHARTGKIRILATSGTQRNAFLPDTPTFAEQGFRRLVAEEVVAFHLPARTPRPIVEAANQSINNALKDPSVVKALAGVGVAAKGSTPEELDQLLRSEHARWAASIKRIGFTAQS